MAVNPIRDQKKTHRQRDLPRMVKSKRRVVVAPSMNAKGPFGEPMWPLGIRKLARVPEKKGNSFGTPGSEGSHGSQDVCSSDRSRSSRESADSEYQQWLKQRRKLRGELDSMGDLKGWLQNKPQVTELETAVMDRMEEEKNARDAARAIQHGSATPLSSMAGGSSHKKPRWLSTPTPEIRTPSPHGMTIVQRYLRRAHLRLVDLFQHLDKSKTGQVSREDFRRIIREVGIPLSDKHVDELIVALSSKEGDSVNYRDLVTGRDMWILEARVDLKQQMKEKMTQEAEFTGVLPSPSRQREHQTVSPSTPFSYSTEYRSSPSSFLEVPSPNLEESRPLSYEEMEEIGKWDRERRRRENRSTSHLEWLEQCRVVRTGTPAVDSHSLPSTMKGDSGDRVDTYRRQCFREYSDILQLCQNYSIPLSAQLLERALLHPGDRLLMDSGHVLPIRQPGTSPAVRLFRDDKRTLASDSEEHLLPSSGRPSGRSQSERFPYPLKKCVSKGGKLMQLSTGAARIKSKTDCWLTFEEYQEITSHLKPHQSLRADPNAFWPGQLLENVRLCLADDQAKSSDALFYSTRQNSVINMATQRQSWPISDQGYVTYGDIDRNKTYSLG
ncbi:EF-hand calcium-binding domain-containing protein 12-like [Erpetoichthys calabaricus]|uniref:EF-hand domain-containing protein n=1 Tax=Erpetoichthys calabaricus TaxID=27687 RepID=A0A8C4TMV4_ERPCA|nr:EF-hand calcium-binding domain-containing protein 12-like [Erpetoichthys calabaricus]